jgi:hypothetical protein
VGRALRIAAVGLTALVLLATAAFLAVQVSWAEAPPRSDEENFLHGSIGTELMPLPVFLVLPEIFPDRFQPGGPGAGDWVEQYGFLRGQAGVNEGLPVGFAVSHRRPRSGAPSPVPFVGFSCGLCHTARIQLREGDAGVFVVGMGSHALDLFAWVEALQGALLDEGRLTLAAIDLRHQTRTGKPLTLAERAVIGVWLSGARDALRANVPKWGEPHEPGQLRDAAVLPNGPSRTQAFRELVRFILDRPGAEDRSFSKLPPVYRQADREWAQFDGSVRDPLTRSVFAAVAAGATRENLVLPDLFRSVSRNIEYSLRLEGPRWADVFPDRPIDSAKRDRGREVYRQHCDACHGHRDKDGPWIRGARHGEVLTPDQLGTDPERVRIRHYEHMVRSLAAAIPEGSPIRPAAAELRTTGGYVNAPIEAAFSRVPYLHNGSVLTLAELINLEPRRPRFFRGRNFYDPGRVGLSAPAARDARHYFEFDTTRPGNSNRGHDYPWPYRGPGWDRAALEDLLEYLKTL